MLVTTRALYDRKVASIRDQLPGLRHVLLVGDEPGPPGTQALGPLLAAARADYEIAADGPRAMPRCCTSPAAPRVRRRRPSTSTKRSWPTRPPARFALDLHDDDVFWCTADPGWVTGTSYGIIAPLAIGVTSVVDEGDFDTERWYGILDDEKVSVWYTAPTAVRMMMRSGADTARQHHLPALRFIASVGEPLNPEAVRWGLDAFGLPIHDNWWQTETGAIMIANVIADDIRPGSMGRPLPGVEAAILRRDDNGAVVRHGDDVDELTEPMQEGELALRPGWPSMFRGYAGEDERYRACFAGGWYLTGDLARRDADGYIWFVGRGDDVIKSAGHLIGPFEVESVLMEHPAVAEVGVIGKPDPVAGQLVKAFVTLRPGYDPSDELRDEHRRPRPQAPRRRGRAQGARLRRPPPQDAAAARSSGASCGPASSASRKVTSRRWRNSHDVHAETRSTPVTSTGRCCSSAGSRSAASSSTARRRSAASCTCTSARRPSPSACCKPSPPPTPSSPPTASTATPSRRGIAPGRIMAEMYGRVEGCSRGRGGSMHLFDAVGALLRWERHRRRRPARSPPAWRWPTRCGGSTA